MTTQAVTVVELFPGGTTTPESFAGQAGIVYAASGSTTLAKNRLVKIGLLKRTMFGDRKTRGQREIAHGVLELGNTDGIYDAYQTNLLGTKILFRRLTYVDGAVTSNLVMFTGKIEQVLVNESVVEISFTEYSIATQDVTIHALQDWALSGGYGTFRGDNVAPDGVEGDASLMGVTKPVAFGTVKNATPALVNSSRLVYMIAWSPSVGDFGGTIPGINWDDPVAKSLKTFTVYDQRVALTAGRALTALELMTAATSQTVTGITTGGGTPGTFTVASTAAFTTGDPIALTFTVAPNTSVPAGTLLTTRYYYIRVLTATTFTIFLTAANAIANTSRIQTSSAGTAVVVYKNKTAQGNYDWINTTSADLSTAGYAGQDNGFFVRLGSVPTKVTVDFINPVNKKGVDPGGFSPDSTRSGLDNVAVGLIEASRVDYTDLPYVYTAPGTSLVTPVGTWYSDWGPTSSTLSSAPEIGLYVAAGDSFTIQDLIERVVGSTNTAWPEIAPPAASSAGAGPLYIVLRQLTDPSAGTPVASFSKTNIARQGDAGSFSTLQRVIVEDSERGYPAWQVKVNYDKNWTVMAAGEIGGAATAADVAFVKLDYRAALAAPDVSTAATYSKRGVIEIFTLLTVQADAQAEADRLLALYKVRRDMFVFNVSLGEVLNPNLVLELGDVVTLTYPRFDLVSGKKFAVLGIEHNLDTETATLTVWG